MRSLKGQASHELYKLQGSEDLVCFFETEAEHNDKAVLFFGGPVLKVQLTTMACGAGDSASEDIKAHLRVRQAQGTSGN